MRYDIDVGVVCWIKADPHPLSSPALQAGLLTPAWIPRTVIGLVATANTPPPPLITDFPAFARDIQHRALVHARLQVEIDEHTHRLIRVSCKEPLISRGWTPPFKASRLGSTAMNLMANVNDSMKDPKAYPGETSSISRIVCMARHPNTSIPDTPPLHAVVANAIVKFRAGDHTDAIGIEEAQSPYHVPWVWSELLLTYLNGRFHLSGLGSAFPTHSWYVQGQRVLNHAELSDSSFPTEGFTGRTIVTKSLKLYAALSAGAPATGPQVSFSESPSGALPTHPFTLAAGKLQSYSFRP